MKHHDQALGETAMSSGNKLSLTEACLIRSYGLTRANEHYILKQSQLSYFFLQLFLYKTKPQIALTQLNKHEFVMLHGVLK